MNDVSQKQPSHPDDRDQSREEQVPNDKPLGPAQSGIQGKQRGGLLRIRTFREDAERYVKEKGITLSSLIADKKKVIIAPRLRDVKKGRGILFFGIFLLLAGAAAAVFFLFGGNGAKKPLAPEKPPIFYPAFDDKVITVRVSPSDFLPMWQNLLGRPIPREQMLGVFAFDEAKNAYLSAEEWFRFLQIAIPAPLRATFRAPWTMGLLGTSSGTKPIWMIQVSSFSEALQGMLEWEKDIPLVFRNVLPPDHPQRQFERFQDKILANQDVRFLENANGELLFAYSFFDRRILVMTTSFEAIEIVFKRFLIDPPVL